MENIEHRNYFADPSGVLLLASLLRDSTLFSVYNSGKKHAQSIGFLIIRGIHSWAMTPRKTHVDEIERFLVNFFRVQADYKGGECL